MSRLLHLIAVITACSRTRTGPGAGCRTADVLAFIKAQREPRVDPKVVRIEDGEAGLSARIHLDERWTDLTTGERRRIILAAVERVEIHRAATKAKPDPSRVKVVWR